MSLNNRRHYLYELKELGDHRGGLIVVNSEAEIPFAIRRVFYNYSTINDAERGNHSNINSSFVMISVSGSCKVEIDDGFQKKQYELDKPNKALFIEKGLWKTMSDFSADNVLMVFSDYEYDPAEYISSYEEYINLLK